MIKVIVPLKKSFSKFIDDFSSNFPLWEVKDMSSEKNTDISHYHVYPKDKKIKGVLEITYDSRKNDEIILKIADNRKTEWSLRALEEVKNSVTRHQPLDNFQDHWNKSHLNHPRDREPSNYAKDKEKLFPRNSIVCDLGGGDGTDSLYFIEKGHKVYLFDIANLALKRAQENAETKGIENKLITKMVNLGSDEIPGSDNFFDIVYARLSLHYFYQDRMIEIFKDIYRVLKEGGIAYIVIKSPEDKTEMEWLENNNEKLEEGIYSENGLIKTRLTKDQYKLILVQSGIKNFEIGDYKEKFGKQKIFIKSKAEQLLYIEIVIKK